MTAPSPPRLTLKTRFRAWWEGYDLTDLQRSVAIAPAPQATPKTAPEAPARALTPTERLLQQKITQQRAEPMPWTPQRLQVAQFVWGEGFCGPGGPEYILKLSKMMGLRPEHSLLDVGCGLGGPARVMSREFGAWVDGLESDETLAAAGQDISAQVGMSRKTQIMRYRFDVLPKLPRRYDRIFAKEALFTHQNKRDILQALCGQAKQESQILLTDYMVRDEACLQDERLQDWASHEPDHPFLTTPKDYAAMLESNGFKVRVSENISDQFAHIIAQAWKGANLTALQLAADGEDGKTLVEVMLREAEFWGRRAAALKSGAVELHRITAMRGEDKGSGYVYVR